MEKYISKADIIEAIKEEEKIGVATPLKPNTKREECDDILFVIDNIETKEVDLEKELDRYTDSDEFEYDVIRDAYLLVAKHFFELGMQVGNKSQKGENV